MEILVSTNKTLQEISNEFNSKFPYLKLEFYAHTHKPGEGNPATDRIDMKQTVSDAAKFDHDENFQIHGNMQVRTLEQYFQEKLGIGVQVMRKSGNLWLQCTKTDAWTLTKENDEGLEDSKPLF